MDAISDVSRASQIFSCIPSRPPLPDPLDLDELFGFNEALKRKDLEEEIIDLRYFDRNKIFINHVDSFIGKYLVSMLSFKNIEELPDQKTENVNKEDELKNAESNNQSKKIEPGKTVSKSKKDRSPKSAKDGKGIAKPDKKRKSSSAQKVLTMPDEESIDFRDSLLVGLPIFDTSRLTVAEYYEMLELDPGPDREEFLKDKLEKYTDDFKTDSFTKKGSGEANVRKTTVRENKSGVFEITGTLQNDGVTEGYVQEGVSEIIKISQENPDFLDHLVKCGVIIYNITDGLDQVIEATQVLSALLNRMQEMKENEESQAFIPPLFILLSSFMTWTLTKPFIPKEPELPFIEKDYRKRKPHPNYQLHYDLEEQVIKGKSNGEMEAVILACGVPYGHEENVLSLFFEMAYNSLDLPVYGSGMNTFPVIHVENIGHVVKEVIRKSLEVKLPFIFAKDPLSYTMKDIVKAISNQFGTGYCRVTSDTVAFLNDEVSQDLFDLLTANIPMESCYPLFNEDDIKWKYETGFAENMKHAVNEFMNAKNLRPMYIVFYDFVNEGTKNIASKLSNYFQIPYLHLDTVVNEYVVEMLEKLKHLENSSAIQETLQETILINLKNGLNKSYHTQELEDCQEGTDLQNELEFFKKLSVKDVDDVPKLREIQKISILKERLKKNPYIYHGYLLEGFPQSITQAQLLFLKDERIAMEDDSPYENCPLWPDYVIYLKRLQKPSLQEAFNDDEDKSKEEEVLNEYLKSKEDDTTKLDDFQTPTNYNVKKTSKDNVEGITDEIAEELKNQPVVEDFPVINFFLESNEKCKIINIDISQFDNTDRAVEEVARKIEENHFVGERPESSKIYRERIFSEVFEIQNKIPYEEEEMFDNIHNTSKTGIEEAEWEKKKEMEENTLAIRSHSLLSYLINFVYPTLTNALLEVTAQRPPDPLEFLAKYLFKNNPEGRMIDPNELKSEDDLMNQEKRFPKINSKACFA